MSKIIINNPGKRGVWCRALTDREGTNVFSFVRRKIFLKYSNSFV